MKRIFLCLLLVAAFLSLTAESCLLKETQVEVPVRDSQKLVFHTTGTTENTGVETVDFRDALIDLEESNDYDVLLRANLENAWWMVQENRGDGGLAAVGKVTVEQLNAKPGLPGVAVVQDILSYQTQDIDAAVGTFQPVQLDSAGVTLMNKAFGDFLEARALGNPEPSVEFSFVWSASVTGPGNPPNVDFTWEGKVRFSLVGLVTIDVPEL